MNTTIANNSSLVSQLPSHKFINKKKVLTLHNSKNVHGHIIGKIAKDFYYTSFDSKIDDVADELIDNENIMAIGVVDEFGRAIGVIPRRELFDTLGQQYGRDLYKNRYVYDIFRQTDSFHFQKNPFAVADELKEYINLPKTSYYLLTDNDDKFAGVFSSKDLLIYLSDQTQKDIMLAKNIQSGIVKEKAVYSSQYFEIFGTSEMAKGIGGDFYSIQKYNADNWHINICDVSGKGISAALLSVIIGGMSRVYDFNRGLTDYIVTLNDYILNSFNREKFITGLFIDFNEKTGKASIFDLGHSYIYLYRNDKIIQVRAKYDNIPLGITNDIVPKPSKFQLEKDDYLILITDGIEEQKNPEGEQYGLKNLFRIIRQNKNNIANTRSVLFSDIKQFRKTQPQEDDMTMIILHYK